VILKFYIFAARQKSLTLFFMVLAILFSAFNTNAQKNAETKNNIIEQRIEAIAGSLEEGVELDYTNLLEDLVYYFDTPLNLNNATISELRELYMLTEIQISNLQKHIATYGKLNSKFELQAVEGFDSNTIKLIDPFVTAKPSSALQGVKLNTLFQEANSDLILRYKRDFQTREGYKVDPETGKPTFLGSPNYMYARYKLWFRRNLTLGFTAEKDAGENIKNGPDFFSGHVMYTDRTFVRKVIVGDFQAMFGQGLTFWSGLGFGKSPFILNTKKNPIGFKPYTSVQEGQFMRGAATTLGWKNFELNTFYSSKKLDSNVVLNEDTTQTDDEFLVSSIQVSGLHRTASELLDKGTLKEHVYGGSLRYSTRAFSIGATAVRTEYDKPVVQNTGLYRQFRFNGTENTNIGLDYQTIFKNANMFGEFSRSANGGMAAINGLIAALSPRLTVSLVHRYFQRDYQVNYANVFAENQDLPANENGLFAGLQLNINSRWTFTGYADLVKYPWMRFRVDAPSRFTDYLAQFNYKPDRKHEFYFRYRHRVSEQNTGLEGSRITSPVPVIQNNWRMHGAYFVHPNIQMKTRAEWTFFNKDGNDSKGFLLYQDIIFKKTGSPLAVHFRYALFDTKSWDTRLYAYENDVLYAFSIPPYAGKGTRFYTMFTYDIMRGVELWVRLAGWSYLDRKIISGGNNEIRGSESQDVHIQLRWRF